MVLLGELRGQQEEEAVYIAFQARRLPLTVWGFPGELKVPWDRVEEARILLRIVRGELEARARWAAREAAARKG